MNGRPHAVVIFSLEDVMFADMVVFRLVQVREENGKVTDFLSFYSLPSSVLGNDKHK